MSPTLGTMLVDDVIPRLRANVRSVPAVGHEDSEEILADMTANAAKMMVSAEKSGKRFTAGNIAHYASCAARSGRRSTWSGRMDVMSPGAQLDGNVRYEHLDGDPGGEDRQSGPDGSDAPDGLHETIWAGIHAVPADPADEAARNIDWQEFLSSHHPRYRIVITILARGGTMREAGRCFGISDTAASSLKRRLANDLLEHFGDEVIHRLLHGTRPGWEPDLRASRGRHACHVERCRHEHCRTV
jgi:hypothetical protein